MNDLIFAFNSNAEDKETSILIESLRTFTGKFSNSPIWLFTHKELDEISEKRRKILDSLNVTIKKIEIDKEILKFPFISHVRSAAQAEEEAKNQTKNLAFLGTNTIFIQEPKEFILKEGINLGYRPVHHTLIGSIFERPIDKFWSLIYQKCNVNEEKVFPMKTHVDGNILRPYINSGYLIVNPKRGFLSDWWKYYQKTYYDPDFKEFYRKNDLYVTFIHQAVLSAVMLTQLNKKEIYELPFNYNYPINLYHESLDEYKPECINDLVTVRYYLDKLIDEDSFNKIPFKDPLKSWLKLRLLSK